ncbi:hypothetical protein ACTOB_008652 [Actinoplanes oblitus]|uniref:PKD domain-containing protein n=1 Tax=Actinoplanes oblitus TaxID=3040509 RepID=A0ABY8WL25_9ACTN|nr:hypothetical protein [Actinoplanes oblitus]WIM96450.1 hypothetical protein ACTOB_008652 [Actinoplanes oblitus]
MPFTQPRRLSAVLAAGLGVVLSAGVLVQPAQAAGTPAQGTYQLNYTSLYSGQSVTITEKSLTGNEDNSLQYRLVDWGENSGAVTFLQPGETSAKHTYTELGSHRVTVALTDRDGNTSGNFVGGNTVTVTKVTGSYKLSAGTTWRGPSTTLPVSLSLAGVPSNVNQVRVGWDDGTVSSVSRTTRGVAHRFAYSGAHKVTVSLVNGAGQSAPLTVGTVNVKLDYTNPTIKITTPAKSNRGTSWKTIRGTAADAGAGASRVAIVVGQVRGTTTYYFNGTKWVRGSIDKSKVRYGTVKNGKWSVKIATPKKGYLIIGYVAVDKVGNSSYAKSKQVKLTR